MMGGPGQMGGPSNIMGGPAPPNETMLIYHGNVLEFSLYSSQKMSEDDYPAY